MRNKSKAIPRQLSSINRMSGYSRVIQGLISKLMIHTARCKVPGSSNWLDASKAGWLLAHTPQQELKGVGNEPPSKSDIYVWWTACCKSRSMSAEGKAWVSAVCKAISIVAKDREKVTELKCERDRWTFLVILYWVGVVLEMVMEYLFFNCLLKPPLCQSVELSGVKTTQKIAKPFPCECMCVCVLSNSAFCPFLSKNFFLLYMQSELT